MSIGLKTTQDPESIRVRGGARNAVGLPSGLNHSGQGCAAASFELDTSVVILSRP